MRAYPLSWPIGWPKTQNRQRSNFKTNLEHALFVLKEEIRRMGGENVVLSSNYTLGAEHPKEPGVVAYFDWVEERYPRKVIQMAIPCDRWDRIQDNVRAIALTVEAMRGMERWGAKHMIKAMFTGFKALPSSSAAPWWQVLGVSETAPADVVKDRYRLLVKQHHPDAGGNPETFRAIQAAYEQSSQ